MRVLNQTAVRDGTVTVVTVKGFGAATPVPAGARGAIVNISALGVSSGSGYLTAYQSTPSRTSVLNYGHYNRANMMAVGLDAAGSFRILTRGTPTRIFVDLLGWFDPANTTAAPDTFVALPSPVRIADSATGNGGVLGNRPAVSTTPLQVAGVGSVPTAIDGALVGLTIVASGSGYATMYPADAVRPFASNVNFTTGRTVPNQVSATTSSDGRVDVFMQAGPVRMVVDLFGYFQPTPAG